MRRIRRSLGLIREISLAWSHALTPTPMSSSRIRISTLFLSAFLGLGGRANGQDIELLGRIHGTRPPQEYYDLMERDPGAFQFRRALFRRGLGLRELPDIRTPGRTLPATFDQAYAQLLAKTPDRPPVEGTFGFPLILGLFSDSDPVLPGFGQAAVQAEFFDGPQANPDAVGTIPEFYQEISGGRVHLTGTTFDWQGTPLTRSEVTAGVSGLGAGSRVGEFIVRILQSLDDGTVDWGHFDNDGTDGIPNSGDDDGFVDVLAVMHPTPGAECSSGDKPYRVWSHRWDLYWNAQYYGSAWDPEIRQSVEENGGYVTQTPSANPEVDYIRVLDYTIQPVRSCSGDVINYIGVFAHELGHGFGLPDLYVTTSSQAHEGVGNWGLMGTGSWGCDGKSAWSPCHLSAWSKEVLGWADLHVLDPGVDLGTLLLSPVETTGEVFRVNSGDGSAEYLLLENRQRMGFDQNLYEPGLLIWHIDPVTIESAPGGINNDPDRMGVWLRQADGLNELGMQDGGRGDAGDPFPGLAQNTEFHAGSSPGSWTHGGSAMGFTLQGIQHVGEDMSFQALTRYQTLTLSSETVLGTPGLVSVDGTPGDGTIWTTESAPFQHHVIEAAPGEPISEGERWGFQGWLDGGPRVREYVTHFEDASFTALYAGREYLLAVNPTSPAVGIVPGYVEFSGGDGTGWVPEGESVTVTATPRTGFEFLEWGGVLQGSSNPASYAPTAPAQAEALFGVTFSAESNSSVATLAGGALHSLVLEVENANLPVTWSLVSGSLPEQMTLNPTGAIQGTPLVGGEFAVTLRAVDAIGLQALLPLTLNVVDPEIPLQALASAFLLTGPSLSADTRAYLDAEGNDNNAYDLGDFRAYVLRNPDLETYGEMEALVEMVMLLGDLKNPHPDGGSRKEETP